VTPDAYDYTKDENYTGPTVDVEPLPVWREPWTQPALTPELEPDTAPEPATAAEVRAWARTDAGRDALWGDNLPVPGARGRVAAPVKALFTARTGRPVK
jgi:hypothetical protein